MKITKLTPIIRRLTAGNANMFTGPGTNTYLLGEKDVTVIDPGPPMVNHIEDLISLTGKSLKQILITHTHPDHSPGAIILKEMTGVPLYGLTTESSRKRDEEIDIDKIQTTEIRSRHPNIQSKLSIPLDMLQTISVIF